MLQYDDMLIKKEWGPALPGEKRSPLTGFHSQCFSTAKTDVGTVQNNVGILHDVGGRGKLY